MPAASRRVAAFIKSAVRGPLRRRGVVVGLSGGIDSAVVAALGVQALGRENVFGLLMPERDSSPDALRLGQLLADSLGIESTVGHRTGARRRRVLSKTTRGDSPRGAGIWRRLEVQAEPALDRGPRPTGTSRGSRFKVRWGIRARAARARGIFADGRRDELPSSGSARQNGVLSRRPAQLRGPPGTPNRLEYDQGFFVKQGRRRGQPEADRASLQDAGLRARAGISACQEECPAAAHHRYFFPGADPGGILFRAPACRDGSLPVCAQRGVTVNAPVHGDLIIAGGTIVINDTVFNDILLAGGRLF